MNFLKRSPRKKHSTGNTTSTRKLMSDSGSFIDDLPAATLSPNEGTRSSNSFSSSIRKKILNLKIGPRSQSINQLHVAPPTPRRTPSPRARRSTEGASIIDLEAKLRKLSGSVDPVASIESSLVESVKSAVPTNDSFESELRNLNTKTRRVITDELDANKSWKALAGELNHPDRPSEKLFVESDILLLHDEKKVKSPTEEILKTWSTTGKSRPRIQDLYDVLVKILQLKVAKQLMFDVKGTNISLSLGDDSEQFALQSNAHFSVDADDLKTNFFNMKACLSKVYQICYDDIESATDSFSPISHSKVAEGNFGIVYKVKIDGEDMAVKLLKEDIQQFANEIDKLGTLNHPNVLALYGIAVGEDSVCMITRFMTNGSLQQMLASRLLDWPLRFRILRDVTAGLEYVHSLNIMHRDVKPANILLDQHMNALIADFGLARQKNSLCTSRTDFAAGTSLYMAPEARYGSLVLVSDVYSFGIVALEVFTGLPVYDSTREYEMLTEFISDKTAQELCDPRMEAHPSIEVQEDCFKYIKMCLRHKIERPNMKQTHEKFEMYFERICDEEKR